MSIRVMTVMGLCLCLAVATLGAGSARAALVTVKFASGVPSQLTTQER